MVNLRWDGNNFRNESDSSGSTADKISHKGKLQQGYRHGSLTKGLIAYYPMEEGNGEVLHDGALDNLGQIKGASWTSENKFNGFALSFDGNNDFVDTGSRLSVGKLGSVTYSAWIYDSGNNGEFNIISNYDGSDGTLFRVDRSSSPSVQLWFGGAKHGLADQWPTNEWTHVLVTYDGKNIKYYENGNLEGQTTGTETTSSTNTSKIGQRGDKEWYADGKINEVRVYNRVLSKPEIQALYNLTKTSGTKVTEKQVPGQDQGGVSRYRFNGDVTDSWGSNDGTDNTSVSPSYVTGVYGQAKNFDGSGDYVGSIANFTSYSGGRTFSAWVKADSYNSSTSNQIVSAKDGSSLFQFKVYNGKELQYAPGQNEIVGGNPPTGEWFFVCFTYDGSEHRLYQNTSLIGTSTADFDSIANSPDLGRWQGGDNLFWDGAMDDVRIYNSALTPRQVEKLYHKGAYRISRESTLQ